MFLISFVQALGASAYIILVGHIIINGNSWFGPLNNALGPILFLTLFVVSALITGSIVLGYPIYLFWEKKERKKAIKLVLMTTSWLAVFLLLIFVLILRT